MSKLSVWIGRASTISIGGIIEFSVRFIRTAILSRLLAPNEFGTTVAITVVLGTVALITDLRFDNFVVTARSDEHRALAAAHMLLVTRGALLSIVLFVSAPAASEFFGVPQFSTSFAIAAIIPFLQSFMHLGIIQAQRDYNFTPLALTLLFSHVTALVAVVTAAYVLRDHRAIIVSYVTEAVVAFVSSRLLAGKPYQLRADRATLYEAAAFCFPLLANGIGLAVMSQCDRLLIGHWFGVSTLATYAVILNVAIVPISLLLRVFGSLSLSYLSLQFRSGLVNSGNYAALVVFWGALATSYTLFVAVTLDWVTPLIFGSNFRVNSSVHLLIVVIAFIGILKAAPMNLLLATGKTVMLALSNLSSGLGLIVSLVLVHWWPRFEIALVGTAIGYLISYLLFFLTSLTSLERWRPVLVDSAGAVLVVVPIMGLLALRPELTFEARGLLAGVGLVAIVIQITFGLYRHKAFANHLLRPLLEKAAIKF